MALTRDAHLYFSSNEGGQPVIVQQAHPQETNTVIYAGAATMLVSGTLRPAANTAGAVFAGFAARKSDATGVATGVRRPDLIQEGYVDLDVAGTLAVNGIVYAQDDGTFHDAVGTNRLPIGKIHTLIGADGYANHAATTCKVFFQATAMQVG
jgi:hypothetical protein